MSLLRGVVCLRGVDLHTLLHVSDGTRRLRSFFAHLNTTRHLPPANRARLLCFCFFLTAPIHVCLLFELRHEDWVRFRLRHCTDSRSQRNLPSRAVESGTIYATHIFSSTKYVT